MDELSWENILKKYEINMVLGVPCSKVKELFNVADVPVFVMPKEDDAVNFAAGATLAGERTLVVIQSSGLGHCINSIASLIIPYRIPISILISCRGGVNEENPVQKIMGDLSVEIPLLLPEIDVYKESDYNYIEDIFFKLNWDAINFILIGV